jgi:hypothetical protein
VVGSSAAPVDDIAADRAVATTVALDATSLLPERSAGWREVSRLALGHPIPHFASLHTASNSVPLEVSGGGIARGHVWHDVAAPTGA